MDPSLKQLLNEYKDVFEVPKSSPPKRSCDHKIVSKEGTKPIKIRSYKHPPSQKDDVEAMVKELLERHVISAQGVATDPSKVIAIVEWPLPKTLKQLRGFLGLTAYYRRFIKGYAIFSQPLTRLLSKDSFKYFKIVNDHVSLKYLSHQRLSTPTQLKWLSKLIGFNYEINYKTGSDNGGKLVVGLDEPSRLSIIKHFHDDANGGHSCVSSTVQKVTTCFYWKKMKSHVKQYVRECQACQSFKSDLSPYPRLLHPLPIPTRVWIDITMDFIEGLSNSNGKSVIFVVVDRCHFMTLSHPFKAATVALYFLNNVYKLHGLPERIISDRDKIFLSTFWKEMFKMLKVTLQLSTTYHPQTDGKTEVPPPTPIIYHSGESRVDLVDRSLSAREAVITVLKFHLKRAQDRMRSLADSKRTDRELALHSWVYVKLQPHRQIIEKIGQVAYKLELPSTSQIQLVFHLSQLKDYKGGPITTMGTLPAVDGQGVITPVPTKILDRKLQKKHNRPVVYGLIQWQRGSIEDVMWVPLAE
ncbi:uncharacterized protein [Rutidosis leptorrhynchoides]|uniref:uncharacterized protein n=1 Tax=Rutidosis leptorrhynchoides TaxID=125765 RepID=UPI003A999DA8